MCVVYVAVLQHHCNSHIAHIYPCIYIYRFVPKKNIRKFGKKLGNFWLEKGERERSRENREREKEKEKGRARENRAPNT